jgi:hypothetical protein
MPAKQLQERTETNASYPPRYIVNPKRQKFKEFRGEQAANRIQTVRCGLLVVRGPLSVVSGWWLVDGRASGIGHRRSGFGGRGANGRGGGGGGGRVYGSNANRGGDRVAGFGRGVRVPGALPCGCHSPCPGRGE